jgi:hypothetical protein
MADTMNEQHRDKDQQNYLIDQAQAIRNEIEVSVFGPSGVDTPPCAEAWPTAKLIAELRARVEALEAAVTNEVRPSEVAATTAEPNHPAKPDSSLVERVALTLAGPNDDAELWMLDARAAIREVAAWMTSNPDHHFPPALVFALEQEAGQ